MLTNVPPNTDIGIHGFRQAACASLLQVPVALGRCSAPSREREPFTDLKVLAEIAIPVDAEVGGPGIL